MSKPTVQEYVLPTGEELAVAIGDELAVAVGRAAIRKNLDAKEARCIARLLQTGLLTKGDYDNDKVKNDSIDDSGSLADVHVKRV